MLQEGMSAPKAFALGALSGLAEPVFGILVVLFAGLISPYMPWMLAFSAGAMMYVVVEELIPEAHLGEHSNAGHAGRDGRLPGHDDPGRGAGLEARCRMLFLGDAAGSTM